MSGQPDTRDRADLAGPEPAGTPPGTDRRNAPTHSVTDVPTSLAGRMGRAASRLEQALSAGLPEAVEEAGRSTAESARRSTQTGQWQHYAFVAVLALAVIAATVLALRSCEVISP